jgi:CDP-diacylglycerol pyrophosphatase
MKTVWILSGVAVLTVSAAFATYAMELPRMALWQVVRACVADFKLTGTPFPCLATRRITGVEDPILLSPGAPNYFDAAWRARTFLKGPDGQAPERDAVALVVNSAIVRGQDQLHIHVGCLLPYARRALAAAAPRISMGEWAQIGPVVPHTMLWGYRIPGTGLANVNPFRLAAEAVAGKTRGPGDLTVVVAGVRVNGDDEFLILASYARAPHAWWPVGSDDLLDSTCPGGPRRAG